MVLTIGLYVLLSWGENYELQIDENEVVRKGETKHRPYVKGMN
jgi:hypothetical protein